jgi:hypothetical protein
MTKEMSPPPERDPGFSRDKDMERARDSERPADADMDATERSADRRPNEHIDHPAEVDDEET